MLEIEFTKQYTFVIYLCKLNFDADASLYQSNLISKLILLAAYGITTKQ